MSADRFTVIAALILLSSPALAATKRCDTSAEQLIVRGRDAYRSGNLSAADTTLREALRCTDDLKQQGRIYFLLGLARFMNNQSAAQAAFRNALERDPTITASPSQYKPALVETFRRAKDTLRGGISVPRHDGFVAIDGGQPVRCPTRLSVPIGEHAVSLRSSKGELLRQLQVVIHSDKDFTIELDPLAAAKARPDGFWSRPRLWTWISLAGGLVAAGVGGGFGIDAISKRRAGQDRMSRVPASSARTDQELLDIDRRLDRSRLVSNVAWGLAGALAVSTVVLLFFEGRQEKEPSASTSSKLHLSISHRLAGASWAF